jgi:hypothetical protein
LFRQLLAALVPGDIVVADCYMCTYWIAAACQARGAQIVMKNHHNRDDHPADARRLCKGQRLVIWQRPDCPDWMSKEDYQQQPDTIEIRLVDVQVPQKGFRPDAFTVATTMVDRKTHAGTWIASVYRSRRLVEPRHPRHQVLVGDGHPACQESRDGSHRIVVVSTGV